MGDSGSIFLGYIFGSFMLITVIENEVSIYTWIIIFGYFFADTTVTLITRLILVKKWYVAHRSHAYQNLARIKRSHSKVTLGVIAYNVLWLFPFSIWSVLEPEKAMFISAFAVFPGILFSFKYGPIMSSS